MELFTVAKFMHIALLFFAIALAVSSEIVVRRVATSLDVRAIRTVVERIRPLAGLTGLLMIGGIVFGFVAALAGQFDLLRPWLLLSYASVAAAFAIGAMVTDPWIEKLGTAAAASPDGTASQELTRVVGDPGARYGTVALMLLIAFLVFLMVVKPLG